MLIGSALDPMGAGVIALAVQPLLRTGERIRAIVPEDYSQSRFHVVTQQRCICFDRRQNTIAAAFEVRTVVRAELAQDDLSHRADVECSTGNFVELRTQGPDDARILGTAVLRAGQEALHDVETLAPAESSDRRADSMIASGPGRWSVVVTRDQVRARDVSRVLQALTPMLRSPLLARLCLESVVITVDGYDETEQELWEIAEVRTFVQHLDLQFPYWFYFLDKEEPGLLAVVRSVLPVDFTADEIGERLTSWWVPSMKQVTQFAGLDEGDTDITDVMIQRSLSYLRRAPGEPVTPPLPALADPLDEPVPDDAPEPLDPVAVMGDLAGLLAGLPSARWPQQQNDLLVFFWSVLKEKGRLRQQTQVEHVRAVASLLALHKLRALFRFQAFGEGGSEEAYAFPSADLVGAYPRAEPFWIGVHAGADATFDARIDTRDGTSWAVEALNDLADGQYDELVSALRRTLKENAFFVTLWMSGDQDAVYPVPDAVVSEVADGDLDGSMADAWDWLVDQGR
ncbi:hypothetical protein [Kineosporia sp. NBRC 101731]|uniref:hypothetical protein n=1 Tax=Kineosporia sp. NBRC 101731 TaxID=3032199 RepID=UPI0024A1A9C0|nr:hypothetical protein [Kineosporia sp. NBRC 101731]GLY30477.1 hypothetical protein Kisp02_38420 [Kineosporia sp. NBRC 101731]